MRLKSLFFIILFISGISFAQKIYFCQGVTSDGNPLNKVKSFEIDPSGNYLYILLDNDGIPLSTDLLYLFVDRFVGTSYEPFDSKVIKLDSNATWASYNYQFIEPGDYKIYFINIYQKKIAEARFSVKLREKYISERNAVTSSYYDFCQFVFCEIVLGGKPVRIKNRAYTSKNQGLMYAYINNGAPLNTNKIIVDIWKRGENSFDYDEFVETKKFKVEPDWPDTYFKYQFKKPGSYKFTVYNQNEVIMCKNYINVY
ncbi:MAG: hypothetical protein D6830_03665 [Ignavibacteria bacterium]|nr:MAG: hypothetical protein D6830_03665 [Ignavibacteria bacterium]